VRIVVVDTETNGTEVWRHSAWEVGAVLVPEDRSANLDWRLFRQLADMANASPDALRVNRYYQRSGAQVGGSSDPRQIIHALDGAIFASCNVSFDVPYMVKLAREHELVPTWHYSPIDIKSLCYGRRRSLFGASTSKLLKAFGVDVDQCLAYFDVTTERHSALADAYLATALLYEVMGWGTVYGKPQCEARWGSYRCERAWRHEGDEHRATDGTTWRTDTDGVSFTRGVSIGGRQI
jgi:hypothetical protein